MRSPPPSNPFPQQYNFPFDAERAQEMSPPTMMRATGNGRGTFLNVYGTDSLVFEQYASPDASTPQIDAPLSMRVNVRPETCTGAPFDVRRGPQQYSSRDAVSPQTSPLP